MAGEFKLGSAFFSVESDATGLRSQVKRQLAEAQAGQSITVKVKAEYDKKTGALLAETITSSLRNPKIGSEAKRSGDNAGRKFGDGVHSGINSRMKALKIDFPDVKSASAMKFIDRQALALGASIVALSPALASLASSFGLASGAAVAFLPAMIGAGAGVSALALSFTGVLGTLKAYTAEQKSAITHAATSANAQRSSARAIESAYKAVDRARLQQARTAEDSAERMAEANKKVADANVRVKETEDAIIEARKKAIIQLEDLKDAAEGSALGQERAELRLIKAKKELEALKAEAVNKQVTLSEDDLREAVLNVAEAEHDLKLARKDNTRTQKELIDANKAGVNGSQEVLDAENARKDALENLTEAQKDAVKTQKEATQAQEDAATAVADAMEGVANAMESADAATQGATAAASMYAAELAKLSPAARQFVALLIDLKGELAATQRIAETATLPGFISGIQKARVIIPDLNRYIAQMGSELGRAADNLGGFVGSNVFRSQLSNIMAQNAIAARSLSDATVPLASSFMTLSEASAPLVARLAESVLKSAQAADNFLKLKMQTGELSAFFTKAGNEMAVWGSVFKNLIGGIIGLMRGFNDSGQDMSRGILEISKSFNEWANSARGIQQVRGFMEFIERIDVSKILAIASALFAMNTAVKAFEGTQAIVGGIGRLLALGPAGIAVAALGAAIIGLVGALTYLYRTSDTVKESINGIFREISTQLGPSFKALKDFISNDVGPALKTFLEQGIVRLVDVIKKDFIPVAKEAAEKILPAMKDAFNEIMKAYKDNKKDIDELISTVLKLSGVMLSFSTTGITIVAASIRTLGTTLSIAINVMSAYKRAWESIVNFLSGGLSAIWGGIVSGATTAWNSLASVVSSGWNMISSIFSNAVASWMGYMSWFWTSIYNSATEWLGNLVNIFQMYYGFLFNVISSVWNAIYNNVIAPIWDAIGGRVMNGLSYVSNLVTSVMNFISGVFTGAWDGIRNIWNAGINWVSDRVNTWVDTIRRNFNSLRDGIVSAFNEIPNGVISAFNHVIDGVNWLFEKVNALPFVQISPIDHITQRFADGGRIAGPGTGTSDNVPILGSNGEWVIREKAVQALQKAYGPGVMQHLNTFDVVGGDAGVGAILKPKFAEGGHIADAVSMLKRYNGTPYVFGGTLAHDGGTDCSGWVGSAWAAAQGFPNPDGRRWFDTTSVLSTGHWAPGVQKGGFNINLNPNPGYSGHISGEIAGVPFESGGAHGYDAYGPPSGPIGYFGKQYHSLDIMGRKEGAKDIVDKFADKMLSMMPNNLEALQPLVSGTANKFIEGIKNFNFEDAVSGLWGKIFDNGGPIGQGFTPMLNSSGMTEQVITGPEIAMFKTIADDIDRRSKAKTTSAVTTPEKKEINVTQNFYGTTPDSQTKFEMKRSLALSLEGA